MFELQSEKTEYEARIEHAEGKISGEQLQQKINVLEKEQETKIVKHERDKATIEKLETKDVFLSNNSHESNDYLGAIAIDEKKKYFENKDLAEILASQISQSKQELTGLKQHKRNEVADCNNKLNELNNVSQKNQKMIQETLNKSNTPNTLDPPNAPDKVRDQTITDAKIVDKIKKLVKEFMRTENFEIIKTDTLEEMYAKATAVDITREEVENRKDKAKKVLVETATIRRKKRQDRGSVLEQNQDQMNVSERVAAFEKNGESKPDQTVSVKTPNKNGSNLPNGSKHQTNNSFNRSEVDLRDQVKPEPKSINRLSNSNLSKENEQQTNHSLDEPEVGLRKQAKPEIQATNSLPNGASEKDSANARPYSGNVRGLIDKFNSEKKDSHELQKGPRITFAQGHSQQEVSNPNGNKQQTNNSFNRSEDDLREQVKPEPINHLSNSNLSKENEQQTNHSLDESEVGLRKQAKPEIQATNSLSNGASEKDSANNRPVSDDVQSIINQFNSNKETSPELQPGPRIKFNQGLNQQDQQEVSNPNGNKQQTNNSFNRSEDVLREQAKPEPESINRLSNSNLSKENEQQTNHSLDESEVVLRDQAKPEPKSKSINRLSNVSEIVSTFEKNGESKPDQTVSVKTPNKNGSNLPQGNKQQTNNSFNRSEDDLRKQAKPEIQATNSLANSVSEKDSANDRPVPGHVKNLIHKFNNIEEKDSLVLQKGPKANFIHGLSQQEERRPNRIARSRSISHTLHEVHREQTDKGRRNSAPELTMPSEFPLRSEAMPSESPLRSEDRETSSPMYDDSLHERHLKLSDFELDPEKKPFDDTQFDKFQRFENDIPLRYIGKLRNLTNSERILSSLSTTQDLKNHDKLVRRNSAPGVMTEQAIPSHSFDQFDRILIPRVKLRYVNGKVSLSKEITNQTAELNKFPELSSFTNQVLTPGDSLDQPSTPNSDSEINNFTNQVPLPKDSSDLRSVSEGDMNQTSMPENVNSTLDETDSVKKSVSVEDLKLAYVERLRSQVAFVEQKIKHDEELKKYGPYNNFFLDQSKKSKAARSKIEIDLTKNKTLCEGLKTILGDEKKLAEFLEEIQPKDPQVLAKELENVKQDTAELIGKAEELKEITYKDLKKKWYQVLTRPSFYLFLARQVLWVAPMAFFSAMAGALPLMPTGTQLLHGSAVVNWLRGVIIGSYVGQRLVNAVPKIIPRTSKRVQRFAKERFPKTVAALEKGSKTIARPFKSIGKSVRSTARTIGRPLKPVGKVVARPYKFGKEKLSNLNAKTFVPIGKKIKEIFDIAHSEKRSSEENQNLKKGLDANGQRLPFATRVKNAALMTTTNFAKRLWRNKVKTLIGVALFVGLATFGLPLLLTAVLPAISGTLIASVAAIAVPALFTLLGVWVADKYLLKPLQNRLANRENAKREQLFTERSAKVQELGQHHSLTPDFNTRVARVAQIDNEKQTAEKQKTQTSQKTQEQETARTSISSISTLNKQTETDKVRLRDSVSRVLNNPTNEKQSSGRASVSSKNDHQRSEGYGR
ncbi:phage holin family protein [Enterococcus hirae]|uniref:phage holin family protein n=1 Tax=Enterococcus hirae TaxID=1354 RepID=UPI0039190213